MSLIDSARIKIEQAKNAGSDTLSLEGLGLTAQQLDSLIPSIREIPQLTKLNLTENEFITLPPSIGTLTNLRRLDLDSNNITTLPETLTNLTNLERIYLQDNYLTAFPVLLTQMENLEYADIRNNEITDFPRDITELRNLTLDLSNNQLTQEAQIWISATFTEGEIATDNAANDLEFEVGKVLAAIYPERAESILVEIEDFTLPQTFTTATQNNKVAEEILTEFLSKIPTEGQVAEQVYIPVTRNLLETILNEDTTDSDKSTELQKIATALGNCSTPVKSFLIQNAVDQQIRSNTALTPFMETLLEREALEHKINTALKDQLTPNEKIEQVQTLVNSIYMPEVETYEHNTKLRIAGERPRIESKTTNTEYGFKILTDAQATAFATLLCETNDQKTPVVNAQGLYVLDNTKLKSITSAYKARLGLVTNEENQVKAFTEQYTAQVTPMLQNDTIMENSDKPEVTALLDTPAQEEALRIALFRIPEDQREATYNQFLQNQQNQLQNIIQQYSTPVQEQPETQQPLAALASNTNPERQSATQRTQRRSRSQSPTNSRTTRRRRT